MEERNTLKAGLLSPEIRELLKVSPYDLVDVVVEDNEVKLKNPLQNAFEELHNAIKDDLEEAGITDEESALEYFYNLRHGNK